jgi:hypothetical protein
LNERGQKELFDERWYLSQYADVKAAIEEGAWPSAYIHFQVVGRSEGIAVAARRAGSRQGRPRALPAIASAFLAN